MTRLGTPKIGPGRVILGMFGVLFGGLVFNRFSSLFCFVFDSVDLEFVSLFIVF